MSNIRVFTIGVVLTLLTGLAPVALAQSAPTVQISDNPTLGTILTDSRGMTLYRFTPDQPNTSNCTGQCAAQWPPLLISSGQPVAGAGVTGQLGVITRTDGTQQVTYNGLPMYVFSGDAKPGDTNGQGLGNIWYVEVDAHIEGLAAVAMLNRIVSLVRDRNLGA